MTIDEYLKTLSNKKLRKIIKIMLRRFEETEDLLYDDGIDDVGQGWSERPSIRCRHSGESII
jgi:hypothetical protein